MATESSPLTFTQGFMLGQISFLLIILLFMRYVVFSPADKGDEQGWKKRRLEREQKALQASKAVPTPAPGPAHVLAKAAYEMASHGAESTDWINVLFAQVMQGYRNDMLSGGGEEGAKLRVERWLNPEGGRTTWLDPIEVTSMSLGTAYPLFSNARIRPADAQGRIRAEIDVDYNDTISLALSTSVLINFPRPRFAVLPVSLGVELVSIGGTIHDPEEGRQHLHACLLPDFHLNLKTTTLLGSRAKLQDVPKLEQLILSRIRSAIQDRIVHPKHFSLSLPQVLSRTPASSDLPTPAANGGPATTGGTNQPSSSRPGTTPAQTTAQKMIDDLGEEAVEAMSQAVKEGFGRMVHDLGLDGLGGTESHIDSLSAGGPHDGTGARGGINGTGASYRNGTIPQSDPIASAAGASTRGRRIAMPAGFPYSRASSTVDPTPMPTPGLAIPGGLNGLGMSSANGQPGLIHRASVMNGANGTIGAGAGSTGTSTGVSVRTPGQRAEGTVGAGSVTSGLTAAADERFRFRGQFAGSGSTQNGEEARRVGALNSRA